MIPAPVPEPAPRAARRSGRSSLRALAQQRRIGREAAVREDHRPTVDHQAGGPLLALGDQADDAPVLED